jgi:hypothetical protein
MTKITAYSHFVILKIRGKTIYPTIVISLIKASWRMEITSNKQLEQNNKLIRATQNKEKILWQKKK